MSVCDRYRATSEGAPIALCPLKSLLPIFTWTPLHATTETFQTASEEQMPFGGLLGSTFNFVFETQLESLQDGDRFYYLARNAGLNFLTELENNSFANLVMLNTDVTHLPAAIFSTPTWTLEVNQTKQFTGLGGDGRADPTGGTMIGSVEITPLVIRNNPATPGPDTNYLQYTGEDHVVLGGT